jgi:hypothetical protein
VAISKAVTSVIDGSKQIDNDADFLLEFFNERWSCNINQKYCGKFCIGTIFNGEVAPEFGMEPNGMESNPPGMSQVFCMELHHGTDANSSDIKDSPMQTNGEMENSPSPTVPTSDVMKSLNDNISILPCFVWYQPVFENFAALGHQHTNWRTDTIFDGEVDEEFIKNIVKAAKDSIVQERMAKYEEQVRDMLVNNKAPAEAASKSDLLD